VGITRCSSCRHSLRPSHIVAAPRLVAYHRGNTTVTGSEGKPRSCAPCAARRSQGRGRYPTTTVQKVLAIARAILAPRAAQHQGGGRTLPGIVDILFVIGASAMAIERNPYAPPSAAEVALPTSPARPLQVSLALLLFAISLLLGPAQSVLMASWDRPQRVLLPVLVGSGIVSLWIYGLHQRKIWLWWLTVIFVTIVLIHRAWAVAHRGTGVFPTLYFIQSAFQGIVIVLLCLAPARKWFLHTRGAR
jgi:hypothetical protein